jgi:hypothetical protein
MFMKKIDFKKELKLLYSASAKEPSIVDVPEMSFLMIDGEGDPNTAKAYSDAIEALYAVAYTLKFMIKKGQTAIDYGVMPLEGLWWTDDMSRFSTDNKDIWKWTAMIMQPEFVTEELFQEASREVKKKKDPPALPKMRLEDFHEGLSAQIMHIGPYSAEGPTIEKLHKFIGEQHYKFEGTTQKHHEIYLGDPRRSAPEKLKTIIRQPITGVVPPRPL